MKWYCYLAWAFVGSLIGFITCALLAIHRIAELMDTIEGLREYIRYILETEEIN